MKIWMNARSTVPSRHAWAAGRDASLRYGAIDGQGSAYVVGGTNSADYPTTPGAFQTTFGGPCCDGFVSKLSPDGSSLAYSTYLGGSGSGGGNSASPAGTISMSCRAMSTPYTAVSTSRRSPLPED